MEAPAERDLPRRVVYDTRIVSTKDLIARLRVGPDVSYLLSGLAEVILVCATTRPGYGT